jgi:hypothetical protein
MTTTSDNPTKTEIVRGPKLDGSFRPMYFTLKNGRKVRIGESLAIAMIRNGQAVEVPSFA